MTLSYALRLKWQGLVACAFLALSFGCSTEDPPRRPAGTKPSSTSADQGAGAHGGQTGQGTPSSDGSNSDTSQPGGTQPSGSGTSTPTTDTDPAQNGSTTCIDGDDLTCEIELAIVKYTNEFRASEGGLAPIAHEPHVSWVARDWSRQQAESGTISHDGFPQERLAAFDTQFPDLTLSFSYIGENVLFNSYLSTVADLIGKNMVQQWIDSPPHRANMLNTYTIMGAGVWKSGNRWYGTQFFLRGSVN